MINMITRNGSIDAFNAENERQYQQRSRDQAEGADAAMRKGIGDYYAQGPAAAPSMPQPVAPPPAALPVVGTPAPNLAAGAAEGARNTGGAGDASVAQATTSARQMPSWTPPPRAPVTAAPAPAAVSTAAPAPAAPGAPAPAPGAARMPFATAQRPRSSMAPIISSLAATPGTGQSMLHLFTADQANDRAAAVEQRRVASDMEKEVYLHMKNGSWEAAQSINNRYGLGIPPEVFAHRGAQAALTRGAQQAEKMLGTKASPEQHMTFAMEFAKNYSQTGDEGQATQTASAAAMKIKPAFEAKHWVTGPDGSVSGVSAAGESRPTGLKERQHARDGGGMSATERIAEKIMEQAQEAGQPVPSYAEAVRLAKGGHTDDMAKERLALQMAKTNRRGWRENPRAELAKARAQYGLKGPAPGVIDNEPMPAGGGGAPASGGAAPASGAPVTRYDANGNRLP